MRVLLDQGTPMRAAALLRAVGWEASHTGELGLSEADDAEILRYAAEHDFIVVTLDADFHQLPSVCEATKPSTVRVRIEGLTYEPFAILLQKELPIRAVLLRAGAVVSITPAGVRIRRLPLPQFRR
jgi:predicted nuclease of predicted toxin-antitoxin system